MRIVRKAKGIVIFVYVGSGTCLPISDIFLRLLFFPSNSNPEEEPVKPGLRVQGPALSKGLPLLTQRRQPLRRKSSRVVAHPPSLLLSEREREVLDEGVVVVLSVDHGDVRVGVPRNLRKGEAVSKPVGVVFRSFGRLVVGRGQVEVGVAHEEGGDPVSAQLGRIGCPDEEDEAAAVWKRSQCLARKNEI